ncbi:ABC-type sugar transport system, permease component [Hoeflea phototrophica DFL-43]|jgi:multiple sugar transport system permease protein|uniref:ABC-type sugar transport system, permease component n=1 Tax=Hoeflea phototrophica (strain DSM 17068 / NCIMB 14078 / DFL-43) TaxID=411684 RepID=A9D017_HOEPD|nr:sugar ABC transporter permease [Hoeflea phototrophica]EDQ34903.2 ABC-type sugar transport system, permease component [Hoeflea phototrophica DFL-43]
MTDIAFPAARPRNSFFRRNRLVIMPLLFIAPAFGMFSLFVIYPIAQSIALSFIEWQGIGPKKWIGFQNYIMLFNDPVFWKSLVNNIYWLVLFLLAPVIGLFVALYLNQKVFGIRLIKSLFFFPFVVSQVVVGLVFTWFYDPAFGLIATILKPLGLQLPSILASEDWATFGVITAGLWPQTAYCMILYLTGLNSVNPEMVEAARLDGAKGWNLLVKIVLPQLRAATFIAIVVTVIGALRSFDLVAIMTEGGPYNSSNVLAFYMYDNAIFRYRVGYAAAIATILFLIMDIYIVWFLMRLLKNEKGTR